MINLSIVLSDFVCVANTKSCNSKLKKSNFCGRITSLAPGTNGSKYNSWQELEEAIAKELHEAEGLTGQPRGSTYKEADFEAMRRVQMDSFQEDY